MAVSDLVALTDLRYLRAWRRVGVHPDRVDATKLRSVPSVHTRATRSYCCMLWAAARARAIQFCDIRIQTLIDIAPSAALTAWILKKRTCNATSVPAADGLSMRSLSGGTLLSMLVESLVGSPLQAAGSEAIPMELGGSVAKRLAQTAVRKAMVSWAAVLEQPVAADW
eukprot:5440068-Prymnesium_polylepis.1